MDDVVCRHCERIAEVRMIAEYLGNMERRWQILLCRVHLIETLLALGAGQDAIEEAGR